ncbi:MAG: 3-keto-5-aminohexanoate cleavage protein [Xanthobacteraceae bacterium]|nr:3-keto-5-aminohexanoate cleavage protein [Xanthobacteraceae bacterium]
MPFKVWIEAAINGPWGKSRQPGIPISTKDIVADGIASAKAGAAIVHLHVYDEATGQQKDDWQLYAAVIEGIRAKCDAIIYPTIPIAGSSYANGTMKTAQERYEHLEELAKRGLVEWAVVDPGSCNFARFEEVAKVRPGFVYQNPDDHFYEGMRICAAYSVHPSYAIYEPGFTRMGAASAKAMMKLPSPVYRFMFAEEFTFGFPPKPVHLDAHLTLLNEVAGGFPWMIAGLGVDIRPLIPSAVEREGHVRVGLEDMPWGASQTNQKLVEEAVTIIRKAGGEPASASDVREGMQASDMLHKRGKALG